MKKTLTCKFLSNQVLQPIFSTSEINSTHTSIDAYYSIAVIHVPLIEALISQTFLLVEKFPVLDLILVLDN